MGRRALTVFMSLWLVTLAAAFALDGAVARWLYARSFHLPEAGVLRDTLTARLLKLPGDIRTILVITLLLVIFANLPWRRACVVMLCSASSVSAEAIKFVFGRARPLTEDNLLARTFNFVPFSTPPSGMSFPSGHTMLAFATAACVARYYPRWAVVAYGLSALVAAERVLELSHYLSDVVASCGLAILMSQWCVVRLEELLLTGEPLPVLQEEEIAA